MDTIEINVTFYRPVDPKTTRSWASRAPSDSSFVYTAKLHRDFTHAAAAPGTERPDPRAMARIFLQAMEPLRQARRLGAVLMQFPHGFHNLPANRRRLARLVELLPELPLVAEFRHRSWDDEEALGLLRDLGVGFCNIDQPALGSTLPPTEHVTSRIAYVRLHGRNAGNWFARGATEREDQPRRGGGSARYDYLYTTEELAPWVARILRMARGGAEEVFVIANNHYRGKAPVNALMLKNALTGRRGRAPAGLIAVYPDLARTADHTEPATPPAPKQGRLF